MLETETVGPRWSGNWRGGGEHSCHGQASDYASAQEIFVIGFMIKLEQNLLIDYQSGSVIYWNKSPEVILQRLWIHYVHVLKKVNLP